MGTMSAVLADLSTPRYLYTAAAQKAPLGRGKSAGWSPGGLLRLVDDYPVPELPAAPGWLRLRPELAGICGSDVAVAHAKSSFVLSAFYRAEKQILGHEIVAVVEEAGPGVRHVSPGDRVVIDPVLSCHQRGFDPVCQSCREGHPYICERFDEPGVSGCSSPTIGFDAALGTHITWVPADGQIPPEAVVQLFHRRHEASMLTTVYRTREDHLSRRRCGCSTRTWTSSWSRPTLSVRPRRWRPAQVARCLPGRMRSRRWRQAMGGACCGRG